MQLLKNKQTNKQKKLFIWVLESAIHGLWSISAFPSWASRPPKNFKIIVMCHKMKNRLQKIQKPILLHIIFKFAIIL